MSASNKNNKKKKNNSKKALNEQTVITIICAAVVVVILAVVFIASALSVEKTDDSDKSSSDLENISAPEIVKDESYTHPEITPTHYGEFLLNGVPNSISHVRGAISMARSQSYDSASSQFFIVHEDSTYLDGQYAAFGYVTEGIEVVDAVCEAARPTDNNGTIKKDEQPVINSITVWEAE